MAGKPYWYWTGIARQFGCCTLVEGPRVPPLEGPRVHDFHIVYQDWGRKQVYDMLNSWMWRKMAEKHPAQYSVQIPHGMQLQKLPRSVWRQVGADIGMSERAFIVDRRIDHYVARSVINYSTAHVRAEIEANGYWERVKELDRTEAGRRAREMVHDLLNERQQETWEKYGYFDLKMINYSGLVNQAWMMLKHGGDIRTLLKRYSLPFNDDPDKRIIEYRFQMWPECATFLLRNGETIYDDAIYVNKMFNGKMPVQGRAPGFCWHPEEPYPSGDILAAQMLHVLAKGGPTLLREANW